jgi:hypothetical protein
MDCHHHLLMTTSAGNLSPAMHRKEGLHFQSEARLKCSGPVTMGQAGSIFGYLPNR